MDIFVYADESGVFDKEHEKYYVYGGLIFLNKHDKDVMVRKYINAEKSIKSNYSDGIELKASKISNKDKGKLFRSLNQAVKFGAVIRQNVVLDKIFEDKKSKQRYLDYVFKISLKRSLKKLIESENIDPKDVCNIHVFFDEHTTATNGKYELREALEEEFKRGTYNFKWDKYFPPLFPNVKSVSLDYCKSEKVPLIRGADIVANRIYYLINTNNISQIQSKILLTLQP